MALIEFDHVSKIFSHRGGSKILRVHLQEMFRRVQPVPFYALKDVSFQVGNGESLAIVGGNGAGKSTLLSLVAGLCSPTSGRVTVNGHVAALLDLGSGFHPDLTGVENVYLNAAFLGMDRTYTRQTFDAIVDFAGVGEFIHEPLRTYSTGMIMRLAFSVAVHVNPNVVIIDEVLAVGDQQFQAKCFDRLQALRKMGKSLLFVSHAPELVRQLCDRAMWIDHGVVRCMGTADEVLAAYSAGIPPAAS